MDEARWLDAFGLGTFHVALLLVLALLGLHRAGTLGQLLSDLGTAAGLAIFALLWLVTVLATQRALVALRVDARAALPREVLRAAALWGGLTGAAFLGVLLVVQAIANGAWLLLVAAFFGAGFAFLVGSIVGVALAGLDILLLGLLSAD